MLTSPTILRRRPSNAKVSGTSKAVPYFYLSYFKNLSIAWVAKFEPATSRTAVQPRALKSELVLPRLNQQNANREMEFGECKIL